MSSLWCFHAWSHVVKLLIEKYEFNQPSHLDYSITSICFIKCWVHCIVCISVYMSPGTCKPYILPTILGMDVSNVLRLLRCTHFPKVMHTLFQTDIVYFIRFWTVSLYNIAFIKTLWRRSFDICGYHIFRFGLPMMLLYIYVAEYNFNWMCARLLDCSSACIWICAQWAP